MPPGVDPAQAMEAMQGVMKNPAFMQMAEKLGTQMMADPQMASMMQQMQAGLLSIECVDSTSY
jgi:hypothetical protein